MEKIPVTILSGFLGAGKTTLLNTLIKNNPEKKFGIIENEFGEISIDSELVVGADDGIFELANGCVCCTLNEDLIEVLNKLLSSEKKIEHLIIETTGIADPGPVALSFLSDYKIQNVFRLDAIITLADAEHIEQQLQDNEEARKQVAIADLILLNKTDKINDSHKEYLFQLLSSINPMAKIAAAHYGKVEDVDILNLGGFQKASVLTTKFEEIEQIAKRKSFDNLKISDTAVNTTLISTSKNKPHTAIKSYSFVFNESLDILKFNLFIQYFLSQKNIVIYRIKGILNFYGVDEKFILQAVNNQFVSESGGEWGKEERVSKIVFIGKKLDKELLQEGLQICHFDKPFTPSEYYPRLAAFLKKIEELKAD
ncbi:MAG TPA: GTP-binding protein [Cytophagaceae bacterium]